MTRAGNAMNVVEALGEGVHALRRDSDAARDSRVLLGNVLGCTAAWLFAHGEAVLSDADVARFRAALARRAAGEPVAYILGDVGFYGRRFSVTPDVLVPRPESELLVDVVREHAGRAPSPLVCDVGTGSGVLAITLAAELPRARVVAIDVSAAALTLAQRNATALGVADRIEFRAADVLAGLAEDLRFDAIVANLPYVRSAELAPRPDPTSFEPRLALDGGSDGLAAYRKLLQGAPRHLKAEGVLALEAGPDTASELAGLTQEAFGPRARVNVRRDLAGLQRVVVLRLARDAQDG